MIAVVRLALAHDKTILIAPFAVLAWFMMPKTTAVAEDLPGSEKWKRMDLGGVAILVATLILYVTHNRFT